MKEQEIILKRHFKKYKIFIENDLILIDVKQDKEFKQQIEWNITALLYPFNKFKII
jgi:hypothetical protein